MTERAPDPNQEPLDPLASATADLGQVQDLLRAAGRGEADVDALKGALQGYLGKHGPTLEQSAASLTEEMRKQTLAELYKWRAQLKSQLEAGSGVGTATTAQPSAANPERDPPRTGT